MSADFGAKKVQKDQQSHHKSHLAVFAYGLDFLVGDAVRSGCVWASYLQLDMGVDGEKLVEQEGLDLTAAHGCSAKELARIERLRVMLDVISDASVDEETEDEAAIFDHVDPSSTDERAERRRKHLLDDSDVPGESLLARRRRATASSEEDKEESGTSASAVSDGVDGDRLRHSAKRPRRRA